MEMIANRYRVERELGAGAMGRVLLVRDAASDEQPVALKVILGDRQGLLQFKQEFRLMSQLRHPNCCAVYDYGLMGEADAEQPYFTMEVVEGHGLDELFPLDAERFRSLFSQLLLALGYVHQLGFVHCDLKPANVRVRADGTVKLMDYGLMSLAGRPAAGIRGTMPYLCPEMIKRGPIDQRSDLYSLGCLAYEALAGRPPFVAARPIDLLRKHVLEAPEPLLRVKPDLDPTLARVVMRLLAKEPIERYSSAAEVLEALGCEPPAGLGGTLLAASLTGREQEMQRLGELLAAAARREPGRTVAVWGPSGIGKTRLLDEFRYLVQLEGLPCLVGHCNEDTPVPYEPFAEVLHQLVPVAREVAPEVLAREAPVLVELWPELGVAPAPALEEGKKRAVRLHTSLMALLEAVAAREGVVLVLEDWHWADAGSHEFLAFLQRLRRTAPILVVVTSREPPEAAPELADALAMPLTSLAGDRLARLVSNMLGSAELERGFVDELARLTDGNPFFVERVLDYLVKAGELRKERGVWDTHIPLDELCSGDRLPATLQALLLDKLRHLSPEAIRLAHVLAVLGRAASIALLQLAGSLGDDELFLGLHELGLAKIVAKDDRGCFALTQEQFQQALYASMSSAERRHLHAAAFQVLAAADVAPSELAHHALAGEIGKEAIPHVLAAGERCLSLFDLGQAQRLLQTGRALVQAHVPAEDRLTHFTVLRSLGEVMRKSGEAGEAAAILEQALAIALDRPRLTGPLPEGEAALVPPAAVGRMLTDLAKVYQLQGRLDRALDTALRSEQICLEAQDLAGAGRSALTVARIHFYQGQVDVAMEDAARSLRHAQQGDDRVVSGSSHAFLGYMLVTHAPERIGQGVQHLHASLAILLQAGDRPGLNESYDLLGNAETILGNYKNAAHAFRESRKLCQEIGYRSDEAIAIANLATTAADRGVWTEALGLAREARALANAINGKLPLAVALALEAAAVAQLGPVADAAPLAARAVGLAHEMANRYLEGLMLIQALEVLTMIGQLGQAETAAEALEALIAATGNHEHAGRLAIARGEIQARQGLYATALESVSLGLAHARKASAKGHELQALRVQARVLVLAERWAEARATAEAGLALATRLHCQAQRADLLGVLGEACFAEGAPAREHFAAMHEAALAAGTPVQQAEALFGLAACDGDDALASEAHDLLEKLVAPLSEEARQGYLAARERRRVLDGDHRGFAAPARKAPPNLRFGSLGM